MVQKYASISPAACKIILWFQTNYFHEISTSLHIIALQVKRNRAREALQVVSQILYLLLSVGPDPRSKKIEQTPDLKQNLWREVIGDPPTY